MTSTSLKDPKDPLDKEAWSLRRITRRCVLQWTGQEITKHAILKKKIGKRWHYSFLEISSPFVKEALWDRWRRRRRREPRPESLMTYSSDTDNQLPTFLFLGEKEDAKKTNPAKIEDASLPTSERWVSRNMCIEYFSRQTIGYIIRQCGVSPSMWRWQGCILD